MSEGGDGFGDLLDGLLDALRDGAAGALSFARCPAVATSQADGISEVLGNGFHFFLNLGGADGVVVLLGFAKVFTKLDEVPLVLSPGLGID